MVYKIWTELYKRNKTFRRFNDWFDVYLMFGSQYVVILGAFVLGWCLAAWTYNF